MKDMTERDIPRVSKVMIFPRLQELLRLPMHMMP